MEARILMFTNRMKILSLILILSLTIIACSRNNDGNQDQVEDKNEVENIEDKKEIDNIEEKISTMTIEEKIGQLLIVGIEGENFTDKELYQLHANKVGGFIFFSRNIREEEQFLSLLNQLKLENNNNIPLFLAIDEEGGAVSRLSTLYGDLPEPQLLGDINDGEISYEYGTILGMRLNELGLNLNFAPVLDINSNPSNPVIGNRAFGTTASIVGDNGIEIMKGIQSQKVIPAVKHFPGHGDTSVDSHLNLPIVNKTKEELMELELKPFIKAIDNDVDMVMIAHILYSELDSETPSTMSSNIMGSLLREELGYKNIIISDDMTMGAIIENYSIEDASIEFLKNGGDILLICHGNENPTLVIEAIKESLENGDVSLDDFDEKVYRILSLKEKYNLKDQEITDMDIEKIREKSNDLSNRIVNGG